MEDRPELAVAAEKYHRAWADHLAIDTGSLLGAAHVSCDLEERRAAAALVQAIAVDLVQIAHPVQIDVWRLDQPVETLALDDAQAFVASESLGLKAFAIDLDGRAQERWTTWAGQYDAPRADDIALDGGLIYATSPDYGLLIVVAVPQGDPSPTSWPRPTGVATRTPQAPRTTTPTMLHGEYPGQKAVYFPHVSSCATLTSVAHFPNTARMLRPHDP